MSNGTAEKLHPLQNKWCLWEHKVRHGSLPNSGSSPFVALRLLCSLSPMMRAMTPSRREQTLARGDLSPCLCWTQSASTPVPSLLRPRHSKHTELCCLVFNCWKFKVRDSSSTSTARLPHRRVQAGGVVWHLAGPWNETEANGVPLAVADLLREALYVVSQAVILFSRVSGNCDVQQLCCVLYCCLRPPGIALCCCVVLARSVVPLYSSAYTVPGSEWYCCTSNW